MNRLWLYSLLLLVGLAASQYLAHLIPRLLERLDPFLTLLTMTALAYIMVRVGREFQIDKSRTRDYAWDYVVAATAAAFPWVFCTVYFVLFFTSTETWLTWPSWRDALLLGRFASPTSAGILFSMLAAAGLTTTWVFRKARILAIFDDLDTILLMIPLKFAIIGFRWPLLLVFIIIGVQLWLAWTYLHRFRLPQTRPWLLAYALGLAGFSESIYYATEAVYQVPIHIEVLLPAFVLGCVMALPDKEKSHQEEEPFDVWVSAAFMFLVGLSMPGIDWQELIAWDGLSLLFVHVMAITFLANLGKMFPAFCYRKEASWRQRLALAIGMWPRGEVGAGVLILSLTYAVSGPMVSVATLSLALNLALTGMFIAVVKWLLAVDERQQTSSA